MSDETKAPKETKPNAEVKASVIQADDSSLPKPGTTFTTKQGNVTIKTRW